MGPVRTFFILFFIKRSVDDNQMETKDEKLRDELLQSSLEFISVMKLVGRQFILLSKLKL